MHEMCSSLGAYICVWTASYTDARIYTESVILVCIQSSEGHYERFIITLNIDRYQLDFFHCYSFN
jgi:hypothetical protein